MMAASRGLACSLPTWINNYTDGTSFALIKKLIAVMRRCLDRSTDWSSMVRYRLSDIVEYEAQATTRTKEHFRREPKVQQEVDNA
jgi:hypothetical protein